jgi:hypothetical protein
LKEEMESIKNELGVKITKQDVIIAEQGVRIDCALKDFPCCAFSIGF